MPKATHNKETINWMMKKIIFPALLILIIISIPLYGEEKKGGLSLAFDDGYPSWVAIIAPELKKAGGVATAFVNNQRVRSNQISFEDLRNLQNTYRWEIGTHTYHHFHAPEFVKNKGMQEWVRAEVESSLRDLRFEGLKVQSLAFPYNDSSREIEAEVLKKVSSFRRDRAFPVFDHAITDGSYPAAAFDLAGYVPVELIFQWIDFAVKQNRYMFLYGHKVLPDEEFITGTISAVSEKTIVMSDVTGSVRDNIELCLVPDIKRRVFGPPVKVTGIKDGVVTLSRNDISRLTKPGSQFILGECYGTQLSYFRKLLSYADGKLPFYTVSDIMSKTAHESK